MLLKDLVGGFLSTLRGLPLRPPHAPPVFGVESDAESLRTRRACTEPLHLGGKELELSLEEEPKSTVPRGSAGASSTSSIVIPAAGGTPDSVGGMAASPDAERPKEPGEAVSQEGGKHLRAYTHMSTGPWKNQSPADPSKLDPSQTVATTALEVPGTASWSGPSPSGAVTPPSSIWSGSQASSVGCP